MGTGSRLVAVECGLLDRVARREQLAAQGKSGARLERCWLDDSSYVVVKYVDARQDWIMQATADEGASRDCGAAGRWPGFRRALTTPSSMCGPALVARSW